MEEDAPYGFSWPIKPAVSLDYTITSPINWFATSHT